MRRVRIVDFADHILLRPHSKLLLHALSLTSSISQVGDARLSQDALIADRFVTPWSATLSTSIGLAMKARANVKTARLELDSARAA